MRHTTRSAALVLFALGNFVPGLSARARQDAAPADAPASARQADPSRSGATIAATSTATVAAVDPANRLVMLRTADGDMIPVKCGKNVMHLDQIKPGDEVKAVAMGRVALFVGKDAPPDAGAERLIMRTTQDGKPGLIIVDTTQTKEKVEAVDAAAKTVTLQDDDGTPLTIGVGPDVDLSGIQKGDEVTVRATGGLALSVQRAEEGGAQPAAAAIASETRTATVESVNREKRIVTLKNAEGKTATVQLGKRAINFDQIKPGDLVRATMAEEVAVSIDKSGAPSTPEERRVVGVAPKGARPGVFIVDSKQVAGKIESIDPAKRTVTLTEPDGGKARTVKVGPEVELTQLKPGDDVSARVTEAIAIVVEKPQQEKQEKEQK
jgi:Cu/Ag efflux protein CusF